MHTFLGVFVFVLSISCLARSNPPAPGVGISIQHKDAKGVQSAQNGPNESSDTDGAPVFVKGVPRQESEADARHKQYEHNEKPALDRLLTWATVALAFFTGLLFIFTFLLWRSTSQLVKETGDAARKQLRAYMTLEICESRGLAHETPLAVKFSLVCHGQTPASKVRVRGIIEIASLPLPFNYIAPELRERCPQEFVVFPGKQTGVYGWITADAPFTADEIREITSPTSSRRAHLHAKIIYTDAFGEQRETVSRQFLDPLSIVRGDDGTIVTFIWALHEGGNNYS